VTDSCVETGPPNTFILAAFYQAARETNYSWLTVPDSPAHFCSIYSWITRRAGSGK
jgi:hypothetical protein